MEQTAALPPKIDMTISLSSIDGTSYDRLYLGDLAFWDSQFFTIHGDYSFHELFNWHFVVIHREGTDGICLRFVMVDISQLLQVEKNAL